METFVVYMSRSCWRHEYRTRGSSYLISAAMMTDSFEQRPTEYYRNEIDVIWMSANCPTFVGAEQINIFPRASNIKQTKYILLTMLQYTNHTIIYNKDAGFLCYFSMIKYIT